MIMLQSRYLLRTNENLFTSVTAYDLDDIDMRYRYVFSMVYFLFIFRIFVFFSAYFSNMIRQPFCLVPHMGSGERSTLLFVLLLRGV